MSRRLVIQSGALSMAAALMEGGRLIDIEIADLLRPALTDALFSGRIDRVDRRLDAAFVDIGAGEPAFLAAKDARAATGAVGRLPIERLVQEGQRLVVQGLREPLDGKGSRVTADLKLFGFFTVLRPRAAAVEIPGRLPARDAKALLERAERLFGGTGLILRRAAVGAEDAVLAREVAALRQRWAGIEREAAGRRRPGRLLADEPLLERLLRRFADEGPWTVVVAEPGLAADATALVQGRLAGSGISIETLGSASPAFVQSGVDQELERALARDVALAGGGTLRLEETAACIAIDVDGGTRAALDVDLAAVPEIARQIRLRNLGGTIVVDFVDLPTRPQRQRLDEALHKALRHDPLGVQIYPMSPLGLVQLSRPRRGSTLAARLSRPCAACGGTGREPALALAAEALIRDLARPPLPALLLVAPDLARYLRGEAAGVWDRLPARPRLEPHDGLAPGRWQRTERA